MTGRTWWQMGESQQVQRGREIPEVHFPREAKLIPDPLAMWVVLKILLAGLFQVSSEANPVGWHFSLPADGLHWPRQGQPSRKQVYVPLSKMTIMNKIMKSYHLREFWIVVFKKQTFLFQLKKLFFKTWHEKYVFLLCQKLFIHINGPFLNVTQLFSLLWNFLVSKIHLRTPSYKEFCFSSFYGYWNPDSLKWYIIVNVRFYLLTHYEYKYQP